MLTDIFANRYAELVLWEKFEEKDSRFLVQAFRIFSEQLYPYYDRNGHETHQSMAKWKSLNSKLSMELGLDKLSDGGPSVFHVSKKFVCGRYDGSIPADRFMKERLSFIEIAFRERENELKAKISNIKNPPVSQKIEEGMLAIINKRSPEEANLERARYADSLTETFLSEVTELNTRFRQANCDLHYHNGFIQRSTDQLVEEQIEEHFWALVSDVRWKNVDMDMKEAIDRRDNQDRDPAFYAAKALLESTEFFQPLTPPIASLRLFGDQFFRGGISSKSRRPGYPREIQAVHC